MNYEQLLLQAAQNDERFVVLTAENRALIRNVPAALGNRFIDTGITEQTMIGVAAGLALRGRIPVVHALASFLTMRAFEFIRTDVGISGLPVKLSAYIPGFLSDGNGPTHQAIEDVSIMRGIPNMQVFAPADENDIECMLPYILTSPYPSYIRINTLKGNYQHAPFNPGKAEIISEGTDIIILVYGFLFDEAFKTKNILESEGLSVGLVNMRTLKPVDEEAILNAGSSSQLVVTVEDHFLTGGLYSIVAETLLKHNTTARVFPMALRERWFKPALLKDVLKFEEFNAEKMSRHIIGQLETSLK